MHYLGVIKNRIIQKRLTKIRVDHMHGFSNKWRRIDWRFKENILEAKHARAEGYFQNDYKLDCKQT